MADRASAVNNSVKAIAVIGLGKLGSPLAAVMAGKGFRVIGLDTNRDFVDKINRGLPPVEEPGLESLLKATRKSLKATMDYDQAISDTQVCCVVVPTPSREDGAFDLKHILAAAEQIGSALRLDDVYRVISIVSTVMPGDTERVKEVLERSSGKRCGQDFGLCYSPEFIALGRVIDDLQNPDMVLIGESDQRAGDLYESVVRQLTDNKPPVMRMNFINAELSKLALNAYVTTKISYANMLARICERYAGADADVVTNAIGHDSRIGRKYLKGAVAFGGPCFPRDNRAFSKAAQMVGSEAPLAETTHRYNQDQTGFLLEIIRQHLAPGSTVGVLGLAYKADTPVVEESASLSFINGLLEAGYSVLAYDPMAMDNAKRVLGGRIAFAPSALDAIRNSDLVAIMTPWDAFKGINPDQLARSEGRRLVLDAWRILENPAFGEVAEVIQLGRGPEPKPVLETL